MKIQSINSCYNYIRKPSVDSNRPGFTAHPDFNILSKNYAITASSYFRRGAFYGSPCDEFKDVISALIKVFNTDGKKRMLISGIGHSQEPFSMLAVVKNILCDRPIKKNLDLHIVDLQSKPDDKALFEHSFFDGYEPKFVPSSFVRENATNYGINKCLRWRVTDDIFKYLKSVYNNPQKSKWDTPIQEAIKTYPDETFDVISINNTLGYIKNTDTIEETLKEIVRVMKPGGIFITDTYKYYRGVLIGKTKEIYPGIYQKI